MRRKILSLAFLLLFSIAAYAADTPVIEGFDRQVGTKGGSYVSENDDDGLDFSVAKNDGKYRTIFITKKGVLKPNTKYTIKFDFLIDNSHSLSPNQFLHIFVRSDKAAGLPYWNLTMQNRHFAPSFRQFSCSVQTNQNDDYQLTIMAHGNLSGKIANLAVYEGDNIEFFDITKSFGDAKSANFVLPRGAKEFDIKKPANKGSLVINAKDYGIVPNAPESITAKLNELIEFCKSNSAAKLVMEKGTYYFRENAAVKFDGLKDFVFDANNSTFIFQKQYHNDIDIKNCERVEFKNFNIDWDWDIDPIASLVEVVGIEPSKYFDIKFVEYERFPRKDVKLTMLSRYDVKNQTVGVDGASGLGINNEKDKSIKTEWLSDNVLRIHTRKAAYGVLQKGYFFRLQHYYYHMTGIAMQSNSHMLLENVNIYSTAGHAMGAGGTQNHWIIRNVKIVPPFGRGVNKRYITSAADHFHIASSCGFLKIENCEFSYGADDCLNVHDNTGYAFTLNENTLRTKNFRTISQYSIGDKIELRNSDYSPTGFTGTITAIKVMPNKLKGEHYITFKEKLPKQTKDGFVMFNRRFGSKNIILRNSYFHDNRARGILLLASDITVDNCRFKHHESGALKIESGYTFNVWSEGYGASNIVVKNCIFENANATAGGKNDGFARDISLSVYLEVDPSSVRKCYPILNNVLFENNTFINSCGLIAYANNTKNLIFKDNKIINENPRVVAHDYRGSFYFAHCENVAVVNNQFAKSPYMPKLGVYCEKNTVKNLVVEKNEIVDEFPDKK